MAASRKDLEKCLKRKFQFVEIDGTRHDAIALYINGKKVATTRFSRSYKEIDDTILSQIAKQVRTNLSTLKRMCECVISYEEYLTILENQGYLD